MNISYLAQEVEKYVLKIRREIHMYPEVSMKEERTMMLVKNELKNMGIEFEQVEEGGIIGFIQGEEPGKSIILRADLDALSMQESEYNLNQHKEVISQINGAAHTCGHDAHTAILLGAAKILTEKRSEYKGKIILVFEQGEELGGIGGGVYALTKRLVEIGADGVWGLHLKNDLPSGKISIDSGPRMAGAFIFDIIIKGKSGHGSRPDLSNSPIDCFNDFYNKLLAMRLNSLDPFKPITISVGTLSSGTLGNIIPETLNFSGSGRYLHYNQGLLAVAEFKRLLELTCEIYNCSYEYIMEPYARDMIVYNHEECSEIADRSIKESIGKDASIKFPVWMATEPFAYYQKYFPGVFAFLGIENETKGTGAEHHNPKFDVDEDVLKLGVAATVSYALEFLKYDKEINFKPEEKSVEELFSSKII